MTKTEKKASEALDGMMVVVANGSLVKGKYVLQNPAPSPQQEGSLCGGNKFCVVGSLYIGGGEVPRNSAIGGGPTLSGAHQMERRNYLARPDKSHLRLALDALNDVAADYMDAHPDLDWNNRLSIRFEDAIEKMFESFSFVPDKGKDRDRLMKMILKAKSNIRKGLVTV